MSALQSRIAYGTITSPHDYTYGEVTVPGDRWTADLLLRLRLVTPSLLGTRVEPHVLVLIDVGRGGHPLAPSSGTLRRYVDAFLVGSGYARSGRRDDAATRFGAWQYRYPVEPQNRP